jgi:hypothetical protein
MKSTELVSKAVDIAKNYRTLYVMGGWGARLTPTQKQYYRSYTDYNKQAARQKLIDAAGTDTWAFDCVGLIKGILWGWVGNAAQTYGGAKYASNTVPDLGANTMITKCENVSTDFSDAAIAKMFPGEVVWLSGHIGVYAGDGLVVECSPAFENKVQITSLGKRTGYSARKWTKHGKLPYVEYVAAAIPTTQTDGEKAVAELVKLGRITNPDVWTKLVDGRDNDDVKNLEFVFVKWLADAKKAGVSL